MWAAPMAPTSMVSASLPPCRCWMVTTSAWAVCACACGSVRVDGVRPKVTSLDIDIKGEGILPPRRGMGADLVRFVDAIEHRHRLRSAQMPDTWSRIEVRCPACGRIFVATVSPREDVHEGRQA